jgi:hypothetical protein
VAQPDPQGSRSSRAEFCHAATVLRVVKHIPSLAMAEQLPAQKHKVEWRAEVVVEMRHVIRRSKRDAG